jgi:transposase-like protein
MSPSSRGTAERALWVRYPPLSIVWHCQLDVSAYLALGQQIEVGEQACPECGRRLGGWSGYWRWVRGPGTEPLWIRRQRCSRCRRSHALLPDFLLQRRLDEVEVIGQALALSIGSGLGMRAVAERLGVPMTTARDWRRRLRVNALVMATALVALAVHLDPAAVLLSGTDHERAALEAVGAAWHRAHTRFGERVPELWRFWSLISGGKALGTNRSPPFAPRSGADWMVLIR